MSLAKRSLVGLDLTNVFMADVRDGVGVYLSVYLLTVRKWDPSQIGIIVALPGLISILAQSPAGNLIDETSRKRFLIILSSIIVAISCLVVIYLPSFYPIAISQLALGIVAPIFQPCVSAISLGLVGHALLRRRIGRNESFNHAGNMLAAIVAVFVGLYVSFEGIFYFSLFQCAALIASVLMIRSQDINHDVARAAARTHQAIGSFWHDSRALLKDRNTACFILSLTLWNLANGTMLPLLGQKLGIDDPLNSAYYLSLCIIVAQATMILVAPWAAQRARSGRKLLFLFSFSLIPVRAILFAILETKYALISLQLIDGLGAGIYGVLSILMMADFSRGTGRFNLLQGLTYSCMGLGGALSSVIGGYLASYLGYNQAFLWLAAIGLFGAAFFWFFVTDPLENRIRPTLDLESAPTH